MREVKFRGRNSKHNKRIYGDLFRSCGQWFITQDGIVSNPLAEPEDWRVEPETVGQSTGLFDKNGKEIYEGAIVNTLKEDGVKVYYDRGNYWAGIYQLAYLGEIGVEVIGNIHENPELINQ